ncbi:MAG TPA: hypothetical protein VLZ50_09640 [Terracidiphilus sp.]|nr:hypothetical protein [Terracidiphilus sp.]
MTLPVSIEPLLRTNTEFVAYRLHLCRTTTLQQRGLQEMAFARDCTLERARMKTNFECGGEVHSILGRLS